MTGGFFIGDNIIEEACFCSDDCLFQHLTEQEYLEMWEGGYADYYENGKEVQHEHEIDTQGR